MFLDFSDNLCIIIKNHVWYLFVHHLYKVIPSKELERIYKENKFSSHFHLIINFKMSETNMEKDRISLITSQVIS